MPIQVLSQFSNWVTGFISAGQRIFEVMDATVESIIVPGTEGYLDRVPVHGVRGHADRLLEFVHTHHGELLEAIRKELQITGEIEKLLKDVVGQFSEKN